MLNVIKFHVESLVEARGKIFERRIVAGDICVADDTHRYRGRRELSAVTVSAGFVTWEAWGGGVVGSLVTRVAGERAVFLAGVEKFGVVDLRCCEVSTQNDKKDTKYFIHLMSLRFSAGRSAIR